VPDGAAVLGLDDGHGPQAIQPLACVAVATATRREHALLRPPAHRGPLIAAGAVVLAVGIALEELRLRDAIGVASHFLIVAVAAGAILWFALQAQATDDGPPAYQSVLLVTGLLLLYGALLRFGDLLGADFGKSEPSGARSVAIWAALPPGTMLWTSLVLAAVASWAAWTRRSAISLLIAAIAGGIAVLAAVAFVFGTASQGAYRFLLLALAIGLVLGSLVLRGEAPSHARQLINAAGLAILVIPLVALVAAIAQLLSLFGGAPDSVLPGFWELVVLAAGCGLIADGAVDRAPGAAYLGLANLLAFIAVVAIGAGQTLLWWPLILIVLGLGVMIAGLRPLSTLPPEPDPYRAGEQPLAARADEEITLRVRDDRPPA
jgi:hypothetical protein